VTGRRKEAGYMMIAKEDLKSEAKKIIQHERKKIYIVCISTGAPPLSTNEYAGMM
jgi:hypothetical protein